VKGKIKGEKRRRRKEGKEGERRKRRKRRMWKRRGGKKRLVLAGSEIVRECNRETFLLPRETHRLVESSRGGKEINEKTSTRKATIKKREKKGKRIEKS